MKPIIEQIREIKGVVTVEKAGDGMAVVVFEAPSKEPKSLKPEELVDGEIYADRYSEKYCNIFRFRDETSRVYSVFNTENGIFSSHSSCYLSFSDIIRPATLSEKQTLILAEVENGYFHNLK